MLVIEDDADVNVMEYLRSWTLLQLQMDLSPDAVQEILEGLRCFSHFIRQMKMRVNK
jgi:hypothetical protein